MTPPATTPPELRPYLTQMGSALTNMSKGQRCGEEDCSAVLLRAVDGAVRVATSMATERPESVWGVFSSGLAGIVADNLKRLREEANWAQSEVADAMTRLGFESWVRLTVTDVERANRRLSLEELLGLAVLFGVPMLQLLIPADNTRLEWHTGDLASSAVLELLIGQGGVLGSGGVTWQGAARAAGAPRGKGDWRPAADLWRGDVS